MRVRDANPLVVANDCRKIDISECCRITGVDVLSGLAQMPGSVSGRDRPLLAGAQPGMQFEQDSPYRDRLRDIRQPVCCFWRTTVPYEDARSTQQRPALLCDR